MQTAPLDKSTASPLPETSSRKRAILSMDGEDWYQLGYFDGPRCDRSYSMLDGFDRYLEILADRGIPSSLFVVGDLVRDLRGSLRQATALGHDIGSHGYAHCRPITLNMRRFEEHLVRSRGILGEVLGHEPIGFRAPSFAIDRARLEIVREVGFSYDSSRIQFRTHPEYCTLDVSDFSEVGRWVYRLGDFYEFELSTVRFCRRDIPVAGGAYLRWLPWWFLRGLLRRYLDHEDLYIFYIHPFELSDAGSPPFPSDTPLLSRIRFGHGRRSAASRLGRLIVLLREEGFEFTTFARERSHLLERDRTTAVPARQFHIAEFHSQSPSVPSEERFRPAPYIVPMESRHCAACAHLHLTCLHSSFSGWAGRRVLTWYYRALADGKGGIGFVAMEGDVVVGYVCGIWDSATVRRRLLRYHAVRVVGLMALQGLVSPLRAVSEVARRVVPQGAGTDERQAVAVDGFELRPIVIAPQARGSGLAERLISRLLEAAAERGFASIYLVTEVDNHAARKSYAKMGFSEVGQLRRYHRIYVVYSRPTAMPTPPVPPLATVISPL
jgi:ribosomal protein S18 acetylase RimI-like enzyme